LSLQNRTNNPMTAALIELLETVQNANVYKKPYKLHSARKYSTRMTICPREPIRTTNGPSYNETYTPLPS
jgi:hypothetical protein